MAAPDFPASPTVDQVYTAPSGNVYKWDGAVWTTTTAPQNAYWTDTGTALRPTDATRTVSVPYATAPSDVLTWGAGTAKMRVGEGTSGLALRHNWRAGASAPDDATKAAWAAYVGTTADTFQLDRAPAAATLGFSTLFRVDSAGNLRLGANPYADLQCGATATQLNYNYYAAPPDLTKPSWLLQMEQTTNTCYLYYRAANAAAGSLTDVFHVAGPTGDLSVLGRTIHKAYSGGQYGSNTIANGQTRQYCYVNNAWWNNPYSNLAGNQLIFDRDGIAFIYAMYNFSPAAAGFGIGINIEQYNGSAWGIPMTVATRDQAFVAAVSITPMWNASYRQFTVSCSNATGAASSGTVYLAGFLMGTFP